MTNANARLKANFRKMLIRALIVGSVVLLSACAGAPKLATLNLQISTTADVNPDNQGRPSPVILYILELSSDTQFNRLDYRSLTASSSAALGPDLLSKTQQVLQPGDNRIIPMELNAQTAAIGFLAGYRDNDNAIWRSSVTISQGDTKGVSVSLQQQQIIASASN